MKKNKGFTLIELVVVMAIIGVLVLLAMPKFMSYMQKAKTTNIKHDIAVTETALAATLVKDNKFPSIWRNISNDELKTFADANKIYDKQGLTTIVEDGYYTEINKDFLKTQLSTKLDGSFYANNDGTVYYKNVPSGTQPPLTEEDLNFIRDPEIVIPNENAKIKIISYEFPNGIYKYGDIVKGKVKVEGVTAGNYELKFGMIHSKAGIELNTNTAFDISVGEIKEVEFSYQFTAINRLGFYDIYVNINEGGTVLVEYSVPQTIYLTASSWEYFYDDDFNKVSMPTIGQIGSLDPANISFNYFYDAGLGSDYSSALIKIPANSNKSGQISSKLPVTYNTYEGRIKVPDSDALLNGLFLYGADKEDYNITYEVDMEILYLEGKWQLWTTVFNPTHKDYDASNPGEPGVIYQKLIDLSFDPSADYHNYKINYYIDYISFEVDDVEVSKWNGVFDYNDMNLYASTFYTHWLSKNIATTDNQMDVQWIRRAFIK